MYGLLRPFLFAMDPERAHALTLAWLDTAHRTGMARMLGSRPSPYPTRTLGLEIFFNAFLYLKFGYATALAWILVAPLVAMLVQMAISRSREYQADRMGAMIEEIAGRAYSGEPMPAGMEGGLDAQVIYDPPNLTYPYGAYIAVVDIDPDTGHVTVRRFIAVDDCGVRINPMIVDGQIHGGLAEGVGIALMEVLTFDEEGNCLNSSFMDYLIPTALECPDFELGETVTPCPHHPLGAKGVGESPNVGSPPAIVNAVIDALYETHGVDHIDMPCTPARVWAAMQGRPEPPQ